MERYDEATQQRIIALSGQLQDIERDTVSLTQLEAAAEEVGLEPRFVREAAQRIRAAEPSFSSPEDTPQPMLRSSNQGENTLIYAAEGILSEDDFDPPPRNYESRASIVNEHLIACQSPEPLLEPSQLSLGVKRAELGLPDGQRMRLVDVLGTVFGVAFILVVTIATIICYGSIFLFWFILPPMLGMKLFFVVLFGAMAVIMTNATRNLWRDIGWLRKK